MTMREVQVFNTEGFLSANSIEDEIKSIYIKRELLRLGYKVSTIKWQQKHSNLKTVSFVVESIVDQHQMDEQLKHLSMKHDCFVDTACRTSPLALHNFESVQVLEMRLSVAGLYPTEIRSLLNKDAMLFKQRHPSVHIDFV